jgi:hypothetical protein
MSRFQIETGNNELPEEYRSISVDLAGLFHSVRDHDPSAYIKEIILSLDGLEEIDHTFENWERVVLTEKLTKIINILNSKPCSV